MVPGIRVPALCACSPGGVPLSGLMAVVEVAEWQGGGRLDIAAAMLQLWGFLSFSHPFSLAFYFEVGSYSVAQAGF